MIHTLKNLVRVSTYGLLKLPIFGSYLKWLQEGSFENNIERYPLLNSKSETSLKGCYIAGDLTGIPLLKMASNSGSNLVSQLIEDQVIQRHGDNTELIIIGAGVAGISAALKASEENVNYVLLESNQPYSTIANFPTNKPIFLEPKHVRVHSKLNLAGNSKEKLMQNLKQQLNDSDLNYQKINITHLTRFDGFIRAHSLNKIYKAKAIILAIGKSGNFKRLNIPGENFDKVSNRLIDPAVYKNKHLLIVGGGDSAVEASIACAETASTVTLSYRGNQLSKPKIENLEELKKLTETKKVSLKLSSNLKEIRENEVEFKDGEILSNDSVLSLIGKELPFEFFKKSNIKLQGQWNHNNSIALVLSILFFTCFYLWKKGEVFSSLYSFNPIWKPTWLSLDAPFLYGGLYSIAVIVFGFLRIKRKPTPYIKLQTLTLILIQVIPLWILPTLLIPWMGHIDLLPTWFKTQVLMVDTGTYLTGSDCWRIYGLVLAWPLFPFVWLESNVTLFWLVYGFIQSFIIIPWLIYYFGKGAYCGWICSCGALAETVGDQFRTKTPHGPFWKKAENWGQVILLWICFLTLMNFISIMTGIDSFRMNTAYFWLKQSYIWIVDFTLASVLGIGLYVFLGGRFWCRLFCPLAALMHVYTKFSRFRIFSEKEKCISCNICSKVCHQGIDVMSFANKGIPMNDVECVRCSACIAECPTNVLSFGKLPKTYNSQAN